MKLLQDRILKDGVLKEGGVLKVDSFLNHQMDIELINEIGKEFARLFKHKNILTLKKLVLKVIECFIHKS